MNDKKTEEEIRKEALEEFSARLVSDDELEQVTGGGTSEASCECWCGTGLLSTCRTGTVKAY
ncbi:MAG: hypothetical protein HY698_21785 [Deltaproteobacteria bacterium]|nr:hypothetical protein [Deltaproteobacteria bacterium]